MRHPVKLDSVGEFTDIEGQKRSSACFEASIAINRA